MLAMTSGGTPKRRKAWGNSPLLFYDGPGCVKRVNNALINALKN